MRKFVLFLLFGITTTALTAQTWKLAPVYSDKMSATYLSFGYPDSEELEPGDVFFSLWSYRTYDDASSTYFEVEYFRANPRGMNEFLKHIRDFSERYSSEMAVSCKFGVKVKTLDHPVMGFYTCVYDSTGRDFCMYKAKRWNSIYEDFIKFCRTNDISIE